MSRDNSLGNNHLPSEPDRTSLVPSSILLYPASYPFELTEEFRVAFSEVGGIGLPSSYRIAYWQKYVGDAAWNKECAEIEAANQQSQAECEQAVARENQRRRDSNRFLTQKYEKTLEEYQQELETYHKLFKQLEITKEEKAFSLRVEELHRAIDSQDKFVAEAIEDAWEIATHAWKCHFLLVRLLFPFKRREVLAQVLSHYNSLEDFWRNKPQFSNLQREGRERFCFRISCVPYYDKEHRVVFSPGLVDATLRLLETPKSPERDYGNTVDYFCMNEEHPLGSYEAKDFAGSSFLGKLFLEMLFARSSSLKKAFRKNVTVEDIQNRRKDDCTKYLKISCDVNHEKHKRWCKKNRIYECPPESENLVGRAVLVEQYKDKLSHLTITPPLKPDKPILQELVQSPPPPQLLIPKRPQPPADCLDVAEMNDIQHVFKGSQVYSIDQVAPLARASLFAGDRVRPYYSFGGVPFAITDNPSHRLIVGTTGSGKTTAFLRLMSSLLPLTTVQAQRIVNRTANGETLYPATSHEWGRSRTFQAVVYNAKGEYLRYLEAFGFESDVDLFNLDPTDPNGYAWDVAADINDRESSEKFAEQLVPMSTAASRDRNVEFWLGAARRVIDAIIVCFRNAARADGKEPAWTLRDLVTAASTDDSIKYLLRWHDTPVQKEKEIFGLSNAQSSSIMLTLRESLGHLTLLANRWHDANKRGRAISLKAWSRKGANSVLVLPNTKANVSAYGPLNKTVVKALADVWLNEEYCPYVDDNGVKQMLHRHIFIDELGQAGNFGELERLMEEGRWVGINVHLGMHQLSQVRETYGENGSETIIGLCSYLAFLKSNDLRTQKWMSDVVGNCLRSYEKASFSYSTSQGMTTTASHTTTDGQSVGTSESENRSETAGTSDTTGHSTSTSYSKQKSTTSQTGQRGSSTSGTTDTAGVTASSSHTTTASATSGTTTGTSRQASSSIATGKSEARNNSSTEGHTTTRELRGEPAIEPHEFRNFPNPVTTGVCEGVYLTPTLPVFRTKLTMAQMKPEFEFVEKLSRENIRRDPEEDDRASKSEEWTVDDLERLGINSPCEDFSPPTDWTGGPALISPPEEVERPDGISDDTFDSEVPPDEESDDEQPPLADFDF